MRADLVVAPCAKADRPAEGGGVIPAPAPATVQPPGLTLASYAAAKRLPEEFLRSLGLSDVSYLGRPALRIPYLDGAAGECAVRFRVALEKGAPGDGRFRWRRGDRPCPYGLDRLALARSRGYLVLVEGESDTQTLLYHDIPALGLPGAASWREEWASSLDGVERLYLVCEPDRGGETLRASLAASALRDRLHLILMPAATKDASALYLADPDGFAAAIGEMLACAVPLEVTERAQRREASAAALALCAELAGRPAILEELAVSLDRRGVAGETRLAKLIYLALTSRLLARPCSLVVKGPSGGGKSYLAEVVCSYFPQSAYYALSAMSEHALAYSSEPLSHRFLVIYEAVGLQCEFASYLVRSLLSEGRIRYETVLKTKEGMTPLVIEREGPTGLLVTTTAVHLHPENETRLLSVSVCDSAAQTAAVLAAIARGEPRDDEGLEVWRALQSWLAEGDTAVVVPYAQRLAALVPPVAVRLRRDFATLLSLVCAHALLHRASRERDQAGRIVASLTDYAVVRELVCDLIAEGVGATVSSTVRETVAVVVAKHATLGKPLTCKQLGAVLGLDRSAAQRRARVAVEAGYLRNLETRRGQPAQLVPGEALPEEIEILPRPERLRGCAVAERTPPDHTPCPSAEQGAVP